MQQPLNASSPLSPQPPKDKNSAINNTSTSNSDNKKRKIKLPTPQEMISHYESQGMGSQEASIKVIDDLQHLLFRVVSSDRGKKGKFPVEVSRKLDTANARLAILEMKLDSKPGYPESFAIGVASAAAFRGVAAVWPHVAASAAQIWSSIRGATTERP